MLAIILYFFSYFSFFLYFVHNMIITYDNELYNCFFIIFLFIYKKRRNKLFFFFGSIINFYIKLVPVISLGISISIIFKIVEAILASELLGNVFSLIFLSSTINGTKLVV